MVTRNHVAALLVGTLLLGGSVVAEPPLHPDTSARTLQQLRADIEYLASDDLRGRSVADPTIHQAADYIAGRMSEIGLDTRLFAGSPMQQLQIQLGAKAGAERNNRVEFSLDNQPPELIATLDDGMNPLAIGSGSGQVVGPVVFAGYGITAEKYSYDDYQGIDVSGATVIVLRKEPGVNDPDSPFNGTRNTQHAYFATKIENAIAHGAAAMIIVNDSSSVLESVQNERSKINQEHKRIEAIKTQLRQLPAEATNSRETLQKKIDGINTLIASMQQDLAHAQRGVLAISEAGNRPDNKDSIPVVSVARDLVDDLLEKSIGQTLNRIERKIDQTNAPDSHLLANVRVKLKLELQPTSATTSNVVGTLAGRGELANQTIVIGGHYDHVGMGGLGSLAPGTVAVHNGADDNASGTATMLSVAQILVDRLRDEASHRRIVFIAFTGEERGLLGSKFYVRHPRFPLESTTVMLNLDMVGRLRDNELTVYGTGSGDLLDQIVEQANSEHQFDLFKVPTGYGPSDHQSFYEANIPVLFFFTGLHNDYHRPTDDFDKIDFGGMVRITDMVCDVAFQLAVRKARPEYAETEKRVAIRRQMTAFIGVNLSDRGDHVVLAGLTPGGPAERSGLRIGDRLEKLGKRQVRSAADVLESMRNRSPGDQLQVQVIRNGQTIDVAVRLETRPEG